MIRFWAHGCCTDGPCAPWNCVELANRWFTQISKVMSRLAEFTCYFTDWLPDCPNDWLTDWQVHFILICKLKKMCVHLVNREHSVWVEVGQLRLTRSMFVWGSQGRITQRLSVDIEHGVSLWTCRGFFSWLKTRWWLWWYLVVGSQVPHNVSCLQLAQPRVLVAVDFRRITRIKKKISIILKHIHLFS